MQTSMTQILSAPVHAIIPIILEIYHMHLRSQRLRYLKIGLWEGLQSKESIGCASEARKNARFQSLNRSFICVSHASGLAKLIIEMH